MVTMPACDFLVASCSSTVLHTIPRPASEITNSPSLPDVTASSLHDVIETVLASWSPSFSRASRKHFPQWQKFRSPISLALMVLKAQLLALKRHVYILEDKNGSLTLTNSALQSKNASLSRDLSLLRADYHTLLCDRRRLTLAAEQDQKKIKALTSDVDNAQQFILAMVDIKLHENFLHVAANETVGTGEDAEKSLAKAIAQEADREGSLWSRILSFVVDIHSANSYSAAANLAFRAKDASLDDDAIDQATGAGLKATNILHPPPELHAIYHTTEGSPPAHGDGNPSASPRPRPPTPFSVSPRLPTCSPSSESNPILNPTKVSGLGIQRNHGIYTLAHSPTYAIKMSHAQPHLSRKFEDVELRPNWKRTSKANPCPETHKQSLTKNVDKRNGIIIAVNSISQNQARVKEKTTVYTALSSLERICALLSSSDLGSLEETTDDDDDESRASHDFGGSLGVGKGNLTERFEVTPSDGEDGGKVSEVDNPSERTPRSSDTETVAKKSRSSTASLGPDCPELLPSLSSSPPCTPLGSASSLFSERVPAADNSPTSTEFTDICPTVKQEPNACEDSASTASPLKFPMVSSFAKRLSRVVAKTEGSGAISPVGPSNGLSLLENTHSGSSTPTITKLKSSSSPKTSNPKSTTIVSPARQKLSSCTTPSKKTGTQGKTVTAASVGPASPLSAKSPKGIVNRKPEVEATPTLDAPQGSKLSIGRNLLRRLSNIPGSVSRPRFSPTTSESSQNAVSTAGSNQTSNLLAGPSPSTPVSSRSRSQTVNDASSKPKASIAKFSPVTVANRTVVSPSTNVGAVTPPKTKPRSNTLNDFSPSKRSPLSQNFIAPSSRHREPRSSWKRQSVQVVISTHTKDAPTTQAARVADKTVPPIAPPTRPAERRLSTKSTMRQVVKNRECSPPAVPTAAFMKPVNKSATKAAKRMTNSIKPLIPTWTTGSASPSQCGDMFRNSLSMIVR